MNKEQETTAAQLRALGEMVRAGLAKKRGINPKHLEAVRTAVRLQWEQEKGQGVDQTKQVAVAKSEQPKSKDQLQSPKQAKSKVQEQEKKKGQDRGHSR